VGIAHPPCRLNLRNVKSLPHRPSGNRRQRGQGHGDYRPLSPNTLDLWLLLLTRTDSSLGGIAHPPMLILEDTKEPHRPTSPKTSPAKNRPVSPKKSPTEGRPKSPNHRLRKDRPPSPAEIAQTKVAPICRPLSPKTLSPNDGSPKLKSPETVAQYRPNCNRPKSLRRIALEKSPTIA
jgi:hypothetical protein